MGNSGSKKPPYSESELESLREKFPACYKLFRFVCPPKGAFPQTREAYRLCISKDILGPEDFEPTYKEDHRNLLRVADSSSCSVSFMETKDALNRILSSAKHQGKRIVHGMIKKKYGFMLQKPNEAHCQLWVYETTTPWVDFTLKEDIET